MVSDGIINANNNSSRDFAKKKRANRSAKLKQCKLDARREQWLSQVKNKSTKEEVNVNGGGGEFNGPSIETRKGKALQPFCKELETRSVSVEDINHHDSDSESSSSSPAISPMSSVNDTGNTYTGSSSSSSRSSTSSFGSGGCFSGSMTEEEEGGGVGEGECGDDDDGCLDDWEAVADALVGAATNNDKQDYETGADRDQTFEKEAVIGSDSDSASQRSTEGNADREKSENGGILGKGGVNTRAWRPDDAFRPQSLPNLSKHLSFPAKSERLSCHGLNPWVRNSLPPVPTSCPICTEAMDGTDSSFLPCPCGFHLCLFCHKRILEEDGRCPGCRKQYASDSTENGVRLARSSSMFSRV